MQNFKVLSIIIVNYNTGNLLLDCVKSIFITHPDLDIEIIVADNASINQSLESLKEEYPQVLIIQNHVNLGFAKAVNQAVSQAKARFILLLNPDTVIDKGCFYQMISFLEQNAEAGACGPAIFNEDGDLQMSCHYFPRLLDIVFDKTHLSQFFKKSRLFGRYQMSYWDHDKVKAVEWITGACLMIRSELFKKIKGLDTRFFMFCEDIDLCLRIRNRGYKVFYLPQVKITHYKSGSSDIINNKPPINSWKSLIIFWEKYYSKSSVFYLRLLFKLDALIKTASLRVLLFVYNIRNNQKNNKKILAEINYFKQILGVLK